MVRTRRLAPPEIEASIAVLPFADLSPSRDQEYLSDGLTEEILDLLTKVPRLRVAARTSAFAFKGKSEDVRAIAHKLNVQALLEGSVRKLGDRVRVTAQLVNAADGFHLWSETYDRKLTDVLDLEAEIGQSVVTALKLKLRLPSDTAARRPLNAEAYTQYLRARQFFRRNRAEDFRKAVQAYERALAADPGYPQAWAGLAQATFWVAETADSAAEADANHSRAVATAEKAIALGPDLPDGYKMRAFIRVDVQHDWEGGRRDIQRALALNPDDAEALHFYAFVLLMVDGRDSEAIAAERRAVAIDPLNPHQWTALGVMLAFSGDRAGAREAYQRSLELAPSQSNTPYYLGNVWILEGRPAEALQAYRRSSSEEMVLAGAAMAEYDLGHREEAQRIADDAGKRFGHIAAYQLGEVYAHRGDLDNAFRWLERAYDQRDGGLSYFKRDPLLAKLRHDPRYTALLRKLNLPVD